MNPVDIDLIDFCKQCDKITTVHISNIPPAFQHHCKYCGTLIEQ